MYLTLKILMVFWIVLSLNLLSPGNPASFSSTEFRFQQRDTIPITPRLLPCAKWVVSKDYKIVDNEEDYKILIGAYSGDGCPEAPDIDFDKEVLIGYTINYGGCVLPKAEPWLTKVKGKVFADVYVENNDVCRAMACHTFWFTMPRAERYQSIYFEYHRSKSNSK